MGPKDARHRQTPMLAAHPSRPGSMVAFVALPAFLILLTLVSVPLRVMPIPLRAAHEQGEGDSSDSAQPVSPDGSQRPACPSFQGLGRQVDRLVAAIKPGITLKEFTSSGSVERALNFWDEVPGGLRETVFFVGVSDGNTAVTDEVVCRFNERDILISCRRACCRSQSRSVTLEQYDSLRQGESRAMIENRLCTPSDTERDAAGRVKTYYHIALPIGEHWEGQTVLLAFEKDVLAFKGMSPYY